MVVRCLAGGELCIVSLSSAGRVLPLSAARADENRHVADGYSHLRAILALVAEEDADAYRLVLGVDHNGAAGVYGDECLGESKSCDAHDYAHYRSRNWMNRIVR